VRRFGKVLTSVDTGCALALGAVLCKAARVVMFSLGCIEAQHCLPGHCPTDGAPVPKAQVSSWGLLA
jgi:glutamate synthase domain-containing protein 2